MYTSGASTMNKTSGVTTTICWDRGALYPSSGIIPPLLHMHMAVPAVCHSSMKNSQCNSQMVLTAATLSTTSKLQTHTDTLPRE